MFHGNKKTVKTPILLTNLKNLMINLKLNSKDTYIYINQQFRHKFSQINYTAKLKHYSVTYLRIFELHEQCE